MASSTHPVVPELDGPGPCSVVSSRRRMMMLKAGLLVILGERMVEKERGGGVIRA